MPLFWYSDTEQAREAALSSRRPILLQFEREHCAGCRKLEETTYLNQSVQEELSNWFIPLRLNILQQRALRSQLAAVWTPSFYVLDYHLKSYFSLSGYLPVEDFRLFLRLALAHYLIPRGRYAQAIETLNEGISLFPENPRTPTLLYWRGIAEYLSGWNKARFYQTLTELREKYPNSAEARMWPWEEE